MSTKNLARTVIEGGRRRYNKWERRYSHSEERAAERVCEGRARDGDDVDELVWPVRDPVRRSFFDKLSPGEQWMLAQVGRAWDRVRSELTARFDTRTLAGRHIVFDHLLPRPSDRDETWRVARGGVRFHVDRQRILRVTFVPRQRRAGPTTAPLDAHRASALAQGRRVVRHGAHLYWLVRVTPHEPGGEPRYRQERELSEREREALQALSAEARATLELTPTATAA